MDMLLTAGERISMALVCMALADRGVTSASFTGSQAGIITDGDHTRAKILEMRPTRIQDALDAGLTPVVAGFQGMSHRSRYYDARARRLRRHGGRARRGLGADVCEIYTDVTGVFSADPRVVPKARQVGHVSPLTR
jgi:aspartate kinase